MLLKLTTDGHKASRGLSVRAELLVKQCSSTFAGKTSISPLRKEAGSFLVRF